MKRKIIGLLFLGLLLTGCSETVVYIPEDAGQMEDGIVVYIPADPEKESEEAATEPAPAQTQPAPTDPELKNAATVSKKTSGSSQKSSSSSNKNQTPNKDTITGSTKPDASQTPDTEEPGGSGQTTVTAPPETEPPSYDISGYAVGSLEYAMLDRINEYRREAELEELYLDEYLCAIASYRGFEASLVWSHTRPDGRHYATVLDDYGYGGSAAGELLGYATGDGAAIADKWMNSESHRALLLGSSSTVGIGVYSAGGVTYVACLLVG